jgi:hypothetical protein
MVTPRARAARSREENHRKERGDDRDPCLGPVGATHRVAIESVTARATSSAAGCVNFFRARILD